MVYLESQGEGHLGRRGEPPYQNSTTYGNSHRTQAQGNRPDSQWKYRDPRGALIWLMHCIAVSDSEPFDIAAGDAELNPEAHNFRRAILTVNGAGYAGWELREKGVVARAAVVEGGWTVLASVPEGEEPAVTLLRDEIIVA
jgi:hypothetical protein